MRRAIHNGDIDFGQWRNAVIASCAGNRSWLYAAAEESGVFTSLRQAAENLGASGQIISIKYLAQQAQMSPPISVLALMALAKRLHPPPTTEFVYAVVVSSDGGATWSPAGPNGRVTELVQFPPPDTPGNSQGGYNMSIAVSPAHPDTIALGWRRGPWVGRNTPIAFTWEEHGDDGAPGGASPHLHSDIHGLHFDSHDPQGRSLYVCSDGGVAFTRDLGANFDSSINAGLANLQFQSFPARQSNGASGASSDHRGLGRGGAARQRSRFFICCI